MSDLDLQKQNAAAAAQEFVSAGMIVGLGTGSTAAHFVRQLAARRLKLTCVSTSLATAALAQELGMRVVSPDMVTSIDVTVDGADEADREFRLIKGGGAALLREKIVAASSKSMVVIADEAKLVPALGKFPLPVEVTPFARTLTARKVEAALAAGDVSGTAVVLRERAPGEPLVTDGGNNILDCRCEKIGKPEALAAALAEIPGVVEHGLFLGMATTLILGRNEGAQVLRRG
jgi:ribose 5-phosphate isomerase A